MDWNGLTSVKIWRVSSSKTFPDDRETLRSAFWTSYSSYTQAVLRCPRLHAPVGSLSPSVVDCHILVIDARKVVLLLSIAVIALGSLCFFFGLFWLLCGRCDHWCFYTWHFLHVTLCYILFWYIFVFKNVWFGICGIRLLVSDISGSLFLLCERSLSGRSSEDGGLWRERSLLFLSLPFLFLCTAQLYRQRTLLFSWADARQKCIKPSVQWWPSTGNM